jgi:AcrR family transcriptional regulator
MVVPKLLAPKFGGVRTGGRSARVVDQVLTTTVKLLGASGYGALRIDEVAEASGVNKTTIYRRWPTKSQLVAAALRQYKLAEPARDTGDLEHDLTMMFVESLSNADLRLTRGLMRTILIEAQDPEVEAIRAELRERVIDVRKQRFELAVERGELPPHTDVMMLLNLLSSTIYLRLLAIDETPSPEMISDIVRIVVAGARVRWAEPAARTSSAPARSTPARKLAVKAGKVRPRTRGRIVRR